MVMITNSFDKFPNEPTGLMYEQFGKIGLNPATATTYNWDFSTTPTGWTELDSSKMGITGGKFHAKSISDNSNDTVYVNVGDLGDNWIIRMKAESVGYNAISSGGLLYIGLVESGDKADTWIDTNNLGIMLGERYGDGTNLGGRVVEGGSIISGGTTWGSSSSYIDMADNGSTVYLELKLDGGYSSGTFSATTYTDETYSTVYSGGNNGANTNSITVGNASPSNTSSGLTYLVFKNPTDSATGSTSNYLEFNFDDLQIYSGVTSVESASPKVKQHFIEWFSGKQIPSYWTLQNNTALPTVAMQDSVGGGLLMTNTGQGYGGSVTFNNKRQYGGSSNCTCIMVLKNTTLNGLTYAGFDRNGAPSTSNGGMGANSTAVIEMGASTYFNLVVTDAGTGWDRTATSIPTADSNWHTVKIDVKASDVDLTVDGTLEATRTGVRPSTTMQPSITGRNAGANATTHIRYMECYNT